MRPKMSRNMLACTCLLWWGLAPAPVSARQEPDMAFFYPLVTRRPVIERDLETKLGHSKGEEERETALALALEWPVLPHLQLDTEVPSGLRAPEEGKVVAGWGDVELQDKDQFLTSVQHRLPGAFSVAYKGYPLAQSGGLWRAPIPSRGPC